MGERERVIKLPISEKIKIQRLIYKNKGKCINLYIQMKLIFLLNKVTLDTI